MYGNSKMPGFITLKNILETSIKFWNITARQHNQAYFNRISPLTIVQEPEEGGKEKSKLFPQAFVMSAKGQKEGNQ